ncbi:hypothetical protein [Glycomyces sp. NPDC047010]|uniref:hypothetical protein n=1 Tax=Glycomyces sp. NPDC047010 TaxID=3155023 RepID=UPI0033C24ADF
MPEDLGTVTIGAREIYDEVVSMRGDLGRFGGELSRISDADETTQENLADHEDRLRQMERRLWAIPTAATLLAVGSLVVAIIALVNR